MASTTHPYRRNSMDLPPEIADVIRLKNEFIKLYERDHPQLQQCIKKLCQILQTFEKDYRGSTEGSRIAGWLGRVGAVALLAGTVAAPFTLGTSAPIGATISAAASAAGGVVTLTWGAIKSRTCSSQKKDQMKQLRKDIEAELKEFQDKINPMVEKMKDLHERTEKIVRDFNELDQQAKDFIETHIRLEDIAELTANMSNDIRMSAQITALLGHFSLTLDIISVEENTRAVEDMDKLAEKPIYEETDERELKSKAGKFIAEMRKLINQLMNITDELEITKDQLAVY